MRISIVESLQIISFLFTILIIIIGFNQGLSTIELLVNIGYFITLLCTFSYYLYSIKER